MLLRFCPPSSSFAQSPPSKSMATIGKPSVELIPNLSKSALYHVNSLSPEMCAKVLNHFASINLRNKRVLSRYVERILDSDFREYSGRTIATILNSFVRLGYVDTPLFMLMSKYVRNLAGSDFISEKDLGLIFNAFARAEIADIELFNVLCQRTSDQITNLSCRSCGNIAHALGKLAIQNDAVSELMYQITNRVTSCLAKQVSPQELSNIIYSFGNLGLKNSVYLEPLLKLVQAKIGRFNRIETAAVATALCKLDISDKAIMNGIKNSVERGSGSYSAYELTAVLHAFSQLDVSVPRKLFIEIAPIVLSSSEMNSHTACIAFGAYSRIGIVPANLVMEKLVPLIESESNAQYLVDAVFAICRIGLNNEFSLLEVLETLIAKLSGKSFPTCAVNINQVIYALNKVQVTDRDSIASFYLFVIGLGIQNIEAFDGRQISNILFVFAKKKGLGEQEVKLANLLTRKLTTVAGISPQLLGSCIDSVLSLGLEAPVWPSLEARLRLLVPDSAVDVGITEALFKAGRLEGEISRIILKRIKSDKLSLDLIIKLLQCSVNLDCSDPVVHRVKADAAREALCKVGEMNNEQLLTILVSLGDMRREIFPLNFLRPDAFSGQKGSALNEISFAISDAISGFPGNKIDFVLDQLDTARNESPHASVVDLFEAQLMSCLSQVGDLLELSKSIPYLSPKHDKFLSRTAIDLLASNKEGTNTLNHANALLSIKDTHLRSYLIKNLLPVWLKTGTDEEISALLQYLVS